MISIGTDIGALVLQNTLEQNTIGLNNSIERMTTGYKINHAKDDAAGFSIASSLSSKISSMITVQQNVEDGLALLKTAEGSLDNIMSLLQRLRDLAEQASNEIYGDDSRNALQAEADEIIAQIEQIKNTTEFNGINLFEANNSTGGTVTTSISPTRSRIGISNSQVQIKNDSISTNVLDEQSDSISSKQTSFTSVLASVDDEIKELSSSITANASPNILATTTAAPLSADISGAEDFAGNETKVITIDGVQYTIKNRLSTSQSISYTKDTTTGEVMFIGNRFEIRGQSDVAHNIIINGKNNYVYGGDLDDKIVAKLAGNVIYAGAGNDILIADSAGVQIYGQDGDDIITLNSGLTVSGISGGNGNDTFNLNGKQWSNSYITGDAGNDVFNIINGSSWKLSGGEGDDEFNIQAGSNNLINGNGGVNTVIQDKGTGTTTVNVVGANSYLEDINANETKTLTINGINYNITNNASAQNSIIYSIASNGQITFKTSIINTAGIVIRGEENKSHNVRIYSERITFYGGNLNDVITVSSSNVNVYGLGGDDVITNSGAGCNLYGGTGNDNITSGYKQNFVFGEEGDDTIKIT